MKELVRKLYGNRVVRYVFFGGCTTLVNLISYYICYHLLGISLNISNIISVALAIVFAFFVNAFFVFETKADTLRAHMMEFGKFVSARLSTMVIEVGGMWLMVEVIGINDLIAKVMVQFIVLVLNYVFSRFLVFKSENATR